MTGRGSRIADAARAHAGCSAVLLPDLYEDIVVRPTDRIAPARGYYFASPGPSTCALAAVGALRLAGCDEAECVAPYMPSGHAMRNAMVDIQTLARRFGAWVTSSPPVPPLQHGDIWIITDDIGGNAHVGVCLADATMTPGAMTVQTLEGGQFDGKGSTALGTFTRTFVPQGARWRLGVRYLLGYASAAKMPIPDPSDAIA